MTDEIKDDLQMIISEMGVNIVESSEDSDEEEKEPDVEEEPTADGEEELEHATGLERPDSCFCGRTK